MLSKSLVSKLSKSFIAFILAKGVAFIAPILFIKFVTLEEYGIVEYSYSMGSVLAIVISLGLYGAYPYFLLKKEDQDKEQVFMLYGFPGFIMAGISILLFHLNILPLSIHFIILFSLIFAIQRLYSSKLKSEDKGFLGVLIDSGYYFLLGILIIVMFCIKIDNPVNTLMIILEIYLLLFSIFVIVQYYQKKYLKTKEIIKKHLPEILAFSYKLILSGFIVFWLTSSARIYISWFMGYEEVGIFSYYFRMAGISVIIYQFISIAFFKNLYKVEVVRMDKYYSLIILIVCIGCLIFYPVIPLVAPYLNTTIDLDNLQLYLLLSCQMPIWVGFALCESIIGRENVVNKFNLRLGVLVLLFPGVLFIIKDWLNLINYTFLSVILFTLAYSIQLYLLHRKGVTLKRCMLINIVMFVSAVGIFIY